MLSQDIGYPFVGELGLWSAHESFLREDRFFDYIMVDEANEGSPHVLVPLREKQFDASVIRRFGHRGGMWLFGLGLSRRELHYPGDVEVAPLGVFEDRQPADSSTAAVVLHQSTERDAVRVSLLLGRRDVRWIEVRGLDSNRGEEDVLLGTEVGLVVGPSLPWLGDDDLAFTGLLYGAARPGNSLVIARSRVDGLHGFDNERNADGWQDVLTEGDVFAYFRSRAQSRHLVVLRASGAAAWRSRTPFQLTLGGERGLRGYGEERFPGGRRLVFTLEDRIFLGWPLPGVMDVGTTLFTDVGRIWPGDSPFGADSDWRAAAGLGLRISFPAGSRTTYRLDFAWPVERRTRLADFRLRFSIGELIGLSGFRSELQFRRSRPESVAGDLFRFTSVGRQ
jgi:hypothetical protein